ncbi:OmpH family outer membrane protein [Aurantiacibacter aquimixticola]|uniref:OmpH family outer membrane protein n=1 Tax=Aurantiacibacter aquimixticola TaxID=1958945 RepID=A0A419RRF1_9SPHN|nr:OmpH family outer membrane protein [Aurantiacibacter aquimixticola]RJY08346.1 OmpH family outer membrane protein [Aurantiacibacter aquimixticola]
MKYLVKPALAAALATTAIAAPAAAQVNGMATVDLPSAVAQTQAFQNGYQQIGQQYQAQRTTIEQRAQQRQQLVRSFDSNNDGQLDQAESAAAQDPNNATVRQIQAIDQELAQLQQPIDRARVYVVQQIAQQYSAALQQVVSERGIQFVISPDAVVYANPAADVTQLVTAQLNTRVPAATITPPADWQPSQAAVGLFQQLQQLLTYAAIQQQNAAQQQPAATGGR